MKNSLFQKLAVAAAGIILNFMPLSAERVQAASFEFNYGPEGIGILSFDDSSLTGIGREERSLSQLINNDFFFSFGTFLFLTPFDGYIFLFTPGSLQQEPIFSFNSGELVGLNFQTKTLYGSGVIYRSFFSGNASLSAAEDVVSISVQGTFAGYNWEIEEFYEDPYDNVITHTLSFSTLEPWQPSTPPQSVPEPGSIVGLSMLGLGFLLKKKLAS